MTELALPMSAASERFAPRHPADAWFFPAMTALIWLGIIMGFGGEMLRLSKVGKLHYPLIVHIHAVVFSVWLAVFTAQVALVRKGRTGLHRRLGVAAMGLAVVMIVLGPWTAVSTQIQRFGAPDANAGFLAIPLSDILGFAGLVVVGWLQRANGPLHKRLMLLATLALADAGFGRWSGAVLRPLIGPLLEPGFWRLYLPGYAFSLAVLLILPLYDWATRRRVLPGVGVGVAWAIGSQVLAAALFANAAWRALCTAFIQQLVQH